MIPCYFIIMEKAVKKKRTKQVNYSEKINSAYKDYLLRHGKKPATVYQFMDDMKMKEEEFYKYYSSFEAIDAAIWQDFATQTIDMVKAEKVYSEYGVREKMLSFYFTLIEVLKKERSYVNLTFKHSKKPEFTPSHLKHFKSKFEEFSSELIGEGMNSEEIVQRPIISDRYQDGFWLQLLFIISFWLKDTSKDFEKTDAAIEKSANLSFELLGRGPLDMIVDFGKFLYQNR